MTKEIWNYHKENAINVSTNKNKNDTKINTTQRYCH